MRWGWVRSTASLLLLLLLLLVQGQVTLASVGGQSLDLGAVEWPADLSFAELQQEWLPPTALPATTDLQRKMCEKALHHVSSQPDSHETRTLLQQCMIESGCAELLGGAHDRCVQVCRMKTVDLLVAKHMNQFKEDLFDDQYIKCMSQLQPEESPASQETLEVNDLAANVRKSHGKQLKKAVKAAISKMRASSKEVVDQEKVSQKRRSHKVEKLSEKEKADRKVERVARKEKFCRKNGGICDNSKRSKIRCNEDDMAEMRKSFKVMRAMAQEAKVALQAVSDARKAEEEISKKKHQLNQEYDKKKSRSIKDMKESAKSSITSSKKTMKDIKKIRKEFAHALRKQDQLRNLRRQLLQREHELKREIEKEDTVKFKLERLETKDAAQPLDAKVLRENGVEAATAVKDEKLNADEAAEHLVRQKLAKLKEELVDVEAKTKITKAQLRNLAKEKKTLMHMEKVAMEKVRKGVQRGHRLVSKARLFRSNDYNPKHKMDKTLASLFKRKEIASANQALAEKKYKLANAVYRYKEAQVASLRAQYAKYRTRCKPVRSEKSTAETLADLEVRAHKAKERVSRAKKAMEVAQRAFRLATKLDHAVVRATKELKHKGSSAALGSSNVQERDLFGIGSEEEEEEEEEE